MLGVCSSALLFTWYPCSFNRFSSDIVTLDKDLMNDINTYSDMLFGVVGVVVTVIVAVPILTVAMVPVLAMCYWYGDR